MSAMPSRPLGQLPYYAPATAPAPASASLAGRSMAVARPSMPSSSSSSSSPRPPILAKRKRASKPKVRTGCKTCKIRRVKCDETKPDCKRCTSTGRKCDGYEFPRPGSTVSLANSRPAASTTGSPPHHPPRARFPYIFQPDSISKPFHGSTQERRVFHRFQYCTVPAFAGGSETGFWTHLVLQVGRDEAVVRNAIVALGTLHEDYQDRHGRYSRALVDDHSYRYACKLYGGALRELNRRLNDPSRSNAKLAIIASILFACFEVLRRNNMAAVIHYQQGMRELIRQMNLPGPGGDADTDAVAVRAADPSAGPARTPFREIPQGEVDELLRVFARYDIQACTFSKDRAEPLLTHVARGPRVLPSSLSLAQVRNHLDNLLVSVYQLVKSDLAMYRYWQADLVPAEWRRQRDDAIDIFGPWMAALDDFFHTQGPRLAAGEVKSLLGLRLQIKAALITLQVCIDCGPETTFDRFHADFDDMVSKVEQLTTTLSLADGRPLEDERTPFTMELGIIYPLYFIACKCRDRQLRRRAIAQLKKAGKEGVWEGPIMAVLAERIVELEEQGLARDEAVPEAPRFHQIKKNVEYETRQIAFEGTRALDDTWENFSVHRELLPF